MSCTGAVSSLHSSIRHPAARFLKLAVPDVARSSTRVDLPHTATTGSVGAPLRFLVAMEQASSTHEGALGENHLQRDETSSQVQATNGSVSSSLSLPPKVWDIIADFLFPTIQPDNHVFPHSWGKVFRDRDPFKVTHYRDLLALAMTCSTLADLALPKLYRAPFLSNGVKKFVHALCRNDQGRLVPDTSKKALWIQALLLQDAIRPDSECKHFCACCVHVALSLAANVRHLSLRGLDETWDDVDEELPDHPVVHFLAKTTRCRPRSLTLIWDGFAMPFSVADATSFAPLSEVTHLHFVNLTPSESLIAFLVGDTNMIRESSDPLTAQMQADIAANHSPRQKLECLRLSELRPEALHYFGDYVAWRKARDAYYRLPPEMQALRTEPPRPIVTTEDPTFQDALYDLAANSHRLPYLRLLILDTQIYPMSQPSDALKLLVKEGTLTDVSKRFPALSQSGCGCRPQVHSATAFVSSLFNNAVRNGVQADSMVATNLLCAKEGASSWTNALIRMDKHWRLTQEGKHALIKLWNSSRSKHATDATVPVHTEIRIAARTNRTASSSEQERNFYCAVENLKSPSTACSSASDQDGDSTHDLGVWADPDVFSLIETKPWLPYLQLNE